MGLDAVELVMEVEEKYGINLPDSRLERIRTVADMAAAVIALLPTSSFVCPTARAFYDLRRTLVARTGVRKRDVRPGSLIAEVIPSPKAVWADLRASHPMLPRLVIARGVDSGMLLLAVLCVFGTAAFGWWTFDQAGPWIGSILTLAVAIAAIAAFQAANKAFATSVPDDLVTVGDLARTSVAMEAEPGTGAHLIHQARILQEVREMVASQLGLPMEEVRPESRFVEDLGVD